VEAVREKLNEEVNEHRGVVRRQIEEISQEMNKRTRDLEAELTGQITQAKNDVAAVMQEMVELREQINSKVTDGVRAVSESVVDCRNQIVTEKENNSVKFQKVNQEIDSLKARLASKGNTELNVTQVDGASQSTSISSGSVSEVNVSKHVSTCDEVTHVEIARENNKAIVHATFEMPNIRDICSELSLTTFVDCNK
jgi:CRP-like cAMP-binding protein